MHLRAYDSGRPRVTHSYWYRPESTGDVGADELSSLRLGYDDVALCVRRERDLVCSVLVGRLARRPGAGHGARPAAVWTRLVGIRSRTSVQEPARIACRQLVAIPRGDRGASRIADRAGSACALVNAGGAVEVRIDGTALRRLLVGVVDGGAGVLAGVRQEAGSHRRDDSNVVAGHRRIRRNRGDGRRVHGADRPVGSDGAVWGTNRDIGSACAGVRCVAAGAGRRSTGESLADQAE